MIELFLGTPLSRYVSISKISNVLAKLKYYLKHGFPYNIFPKLICSYEYYLYDNVLAEIIQKIQLVVSIKIFFKEFFFLFSSFNVFYTTL